MRFWRFAILSACVTCVLLSGTSLLAFELKSPAFAAGGSIPSLYTCQGKDISPPLTWSKAPEKTRSFVLICDDPDAPVMTWVHWVYFDIPPAVTALPEGMPKDEKPAMGASTAGAASAISATAGPARPGASTATSSGSPPWTPS